MRRLNKTIYNKLVLQAEEARETEGLTKLANHVFDSVGALHAEDLEVYSKKDLKSDIRKQLWKAAVAVISYYDPKSADIQILDEVIADISEEFLEKISSRLPDIDIIGKSEAKIPGEE